MKKHGVEDMRRLVLRRRSAWRPVVLVLAVAALMLAGVGNASAATLTVCPSGCTYTTIQDALDAASTGDTIGIGPGTYDGGFTMKSVTLRGAGAARTNISFAAATIAGRSPSSRARRL
jgi:pectin methylesterase-like acyl-CoA thioesterase